MKDTTNGDAIRVYEIMKEKNYTSDEIEAFLNFLDQRVIEVTQPLVQRMDQLEMMLFAGFGILAVLILTCPGILQKVFQLAFSRKVLD